MQVKATYSVCTDCYEVEATGDSTGLDYYYGKDADTRLAEIEEGYGKLLAEGGYLNAGDTTDEFSRSPCECCGSRLAGSRHELIVLV